ncbi:MAG: hypothetical protein Q7U04_10090 [Bacteriovorax sp.]|nr:hypothetical protein [Bacteriovorax sp.]
MKFYYLVHFQFLGFRYHGWQKQTELKTVQQTIEDCFSKYLGHSSFRTIGASRTDSMVSANHSLFEIISESEIEDELFLANFNQFLPADIKVLKMEKVDKGFKIISAPKVKEYLYFFSFGIKNHPFSAPFMTHINENLNLELMKEAAKLFEGTHYLKSFCFKPKENQNFQREIIHSEIEMNNILTANFFPDKSYLFRIKAKSFMRYQIRMMMGALFEVGMNKLTIDELKKSLSSDENLKVMIAPASGLILNYSLIE